MDEALAPWNMEFIRLTAKLDFDAKVPIPFSVFPSSYRNDAAAASIGLEEARETGFGPSRVGREDRYTSVSASLPHRRRRDHPRNDEDVELDVTVYEEEDRRHPHRREKTTIVQEEIRHARPDRETVAEVEVTRERFREPHHHRHHPNASWERERRAGTPWAESEIDITEREYRQRVHRTPAEEYESRPATEIEIEQSSFSAPDRHRSHMGYYDEDGHYHSLRHGIDKATDRLLHPHHHRSTVREEMYDDDDDDRSSGRHHHHQPGGSMRENVRIVERSRPAHTITIPCHHIRVGDLLILQGRPCQVIRITVSAQTGQYRYLGVDLFTKQLQEETSFVSHPSPSVVVQNMLGPVFKQYRVLDIRDDGRVVAMTETGDVKQGLAVIDQGGLWKKLNNVFADGRGSVRVLVISDGSRELAVDYKVVHGSRL
ncbi:MAG: hypothetical protein M1826_000764 [Phylliscum demangeonii]|nr:MAG: hypothetical protein M1826_000764 [Phylliscum demangeonii]